MTSIFVIADIHCQNVTSKMSDIHFWNGLNWTSNSIWVTECGHPIPKFIVDVWHPLFLKLDVSWFNLDVTEYQNGFGCLTSKLGPNWMLGSSTFLWCVMSNMYPTYPIYMSEMHMRDLYMHVWYKQYDMLNMLRLITLGCAYPKTSYFVDMHFVIGIALSWTDYASECMFDMQFTYGHAVWHPDMQYGLSNCMLDMQFKKLKLHVHELNFLMMSTFCSFLFFLWKP